MIEHLTAKLGLDNSAFASGLRQSAVEAGKFGKVMGSIGIPVGAGLALASVAAFAKHLGEEADNIIGTAQAVGATTDAVQAFQKAAKASGAKPEDAIAGIEKLALKIGEANQSGGESEKVFKRLGISLADASGKMRSTDDILGDVADKVRGAGSATEAAQIAFDVFGKSGMRLVGALKEGRAGLDSFKNGLPSEKDLTTLKEAAEGLEKVASSLKGLGAKALVKGVFQPLENLSRFWGSIFGGATVDEAFASMERHVATINQSGLNLISEEERQRIDKASGEIQKIYDKIEFEGADAGGQAIILIRQKVALEKAYAEAADGSAHKLEIEKEWLEKSAEISKRKKAIEDDFAKAVRDGQESRETNEQKIARLIFETMTLRDKARSMDRAGEQFKRAELEHQQKMNALEKEQMALKDRKRGIESTIARTRETLDIEKADRGKFTLSELADLQIGRGTNFEQRQNIFAARRAKWLEERARYLDTLSPDGGSALRAQADNLKESITALTDRERFPFNAQEELLKDNNNELVEINKKLNAFKVVNLP